MVWYEASPQRVIGQRCSVWSPWGWLLSVGWSIITNEVFQAHSRRHTFIFCFHFPIFVWKNVCMYGQHFQQSMDQPGNDVANTSRGQLNSENARSRRRIWSRETGSAASACSFSALRLNHQSGTCSRDSFRFPRRRHSPHIPPTDIGSVSSLPGHARAYRWRSLPRVRRHRAGRPQGSSSNGCCLSTWTFFFAPLFSRNHYWYSSM